MHNVGDWAQQIWNRGCRLQILATSVAAIVLAACAGTSGPEAAMPAVDTNPTVTASGPVAGVDRGAMKSWYAIPYAAPPVGDLRWRAPQPAAAWTAPLANTRSAASCMQVGNSPFRVAGDGEDCLYLDVHAPKTKGPHPVMVWIHGGAFTTGAASVYADPSPLVANDVVVVAMNYRLGPMGFLGHPSLKAADGSVGNYGMMDQQAALRWVRDNIAAFGGDPANVTIFGESAGGFSVMTHLGSPSSAGLFQKAIIQSGAYGVSVQLTREQLEARSTQTVARAIKAAMEAGVAVGCAPETVTGDCLRALPEGVLRKELNDAFFAGGYNLIPSVDGVVLKETIKDAFAAGRNNKVPVLNGSNEDEYHLFLAMQELDARSRATPPNRDPADKSFLMSASAYPLVVGALTAGTGVTAADLRAKHYLLADFGTDPALQPSLASSAAATAAFFSCNGLNVSRRIAAQNTPSWMYEFRDQTALPLIGWVDGKYPGAFQQGAAHAAELQYLFNMQDLQNNERKALQGQMAAYWANFARKGDPNGPGLPTWADVMSASVQALDVASGGGVTPMPASAFTSQHKCDTAWSNFSF